MVWDGYKEKNVYIHYEDSQMEAFRFKVIGHIKAKDHIKDPSLEWIDLIRVFPMQ
jgi:hypothetical protein